MTLPAAIAHVSTTRVGARSVPRPVRRDGSAEGLVLSCSRQCRRRSQGPRGGMASAAVRNDAAAAAPAADCRPVGYPRTVAYTDGDGLGAPAERVTEVPTAAAPASSSSSSYVPLSSPYQTVSLALSRRAAMGSAAAAFVGVAAASGLILPSLAAAASAPSSLDDAAPGELASSGAIPNGVTELSTNAGATGETGGCSLAFSPHPPAGYPP